MNLRKKELISLPVYTQSGQHLGKVIDFEVDASSHIIQKYIVKSSALLLAKELVIGREQIISLTNEKMTVDDLLIKETEVKEVEVKNTVPAS